ncbi:MAG: ribonuclease III [candidate division WOR-3 bacterium]|nr:MAG: ribonuclease III [candidate division WOR-3 bacterium]
MPSLNYKTIERKLKVSFRKKALLRLALTHSSFQGNRVKKSHKSNETLEFLGDAVLELIVREYLHKKFPESPEGKLNEIKIKYTNTDTLHRIGKELNVGEFLLMDRGEELTGGRQRPSNIAGVIEALIGAVYLDGGLKGARSFVRKHILKRDFSGLLDYKSLLNRWAMKNQCSIGYRVAKSHGPPHRKVFHVDLYIDKKRASRGSGDSKKKAQQAAARKYFEEHLQHKT